MATTKTQRVGIWIIAVFMAVGTIGSFAIIVLANQNAQTEQARQNELETKYKEEVNAQEAELSKKYFGTVNAQMTRVGAFDPATVTELKTEDITVGDSETLTAESSFTAYYIGWTPDGKIFDGSVNGESLKAPYNVAPGQVIEGWTKGAVGMKVGGIRELAIPSDLAYKEAGSSDGSIKPNTPIKFVIFVIPTPKTVEIPQELLDIYKNAGGLY